MPKPCDQTVQATQWALQTVGLAQAFFAVWQESDTVRSYHFHDPAYYCANCRWNLASPNNYAHLPGNDRRFPKTGAEPPAGRLSPRRKRPRTVVAGVSSLTTHFVIPRITRDSIVIPKTRQDIINPNVWCGNSGAGPIKRIQKLVFSGFNKYGVRSSEFSLVIFTIRR